MCPAVIETKSLTIKDTGLVRTPINSTGNIMGLNHNGTPGVQKICAQYAFLPLKFVIRKVPNANTAVTAIFPVMLAAPGISPNKFPNQIKKNKVNK